MFDYLLKPYSNGGVKDTVNTRCFMRWCLNLIMRYQLCRKEKKVSLAAAKLKQNKPDKVCHSKPLQGISIEPVKHFEAFKSREDVM